MALSHSEAQVLYARYLKSGMTLEKFCKLHQVPYWDFSDWINQWEKLYGAKYVHIPADTRSAFPVISVQSPVSIQCCWQS